MKRPSAWDGGSAFAVGERDLSCPHRRIAWYDRCDRQEVEVPLSDNEQRLLEQMERALYAEDPKFASAMRGANRRPGAARRLAIGGTGIVLGLVVLVLGVAQGNVWPGVWIG